MIHWFLKSKLPSPIQVNCNSDLKLSVERKLKHRKQEHQRSSVKLYDVKMVIFIFCFISNKWNTHKINTEIRYILKYTKQIFVIMLLKRIIKLLSKYFSHIIEYNFLSIWACIFYLCAYRSVSRCSFLRRL